MKLLIFCLFITFNFTFGQEIPSQFPYKIYNGMAEIVKDSNQLQGIKSISGEWLIPCVYEKIYVFEQGIVVYKENRKKGYERTYSCGFFTRSFRKILPCAYKSIQPYSTDKLLISVWKDNKMGVADTNSKVIVPLIYDELRIPSNSVFIAKLKGKYGAFDNKLKQVIPFNYNYLGDFSEGFFSFSSDGKRFGFLDKKAKIVIPETYNSVGNFSNGFATVSFDYRSSCINSSGLLLFPFLFKEITSIGNNQFIYHIDSVQKNSLKKDLLNEEVSKTSEEYRNWNQSWNSPDSLHSLTKENTITGLINASGVLVPTDNFSSIEFICSIENVNYFAVRSINNEFQQLNYAIMDGFGNVKTDFSYLSIVSKEASLFEFEVQVMEDNVLKTKSIRLQK